MRRGSKSQTESEYTDGLSRSSVDYRRRFSVDRLANYIEDRELCGYFGAAAASESAAGDVVPAAQRLTDGDAEAVAVEEVGEAYAEAKRKFDWRSWRLSRCRDSESEEPEWPEEHACKLCGVAVYRVMSRDGDDVEIDVDPLDIVVHKSLDGSERVVRERWSQPAVETAGGHVLHDPQLFRGWVGDDRSERGRWSVASEHLAEWQWFSSPMSLAEAHEHKTVLRSEHSATCAALSVKARAAKISAIRGDDAFGRRAMRILRLRQPCVEQGNHLQPVAEPVDEQKPQPVRKKPDQLQLF